MNCVRFYKSFDNTLPEPIALNVWKHHLGFIREAVPFCNADSIDLLVEQLKSIKGSVLDLYIGVLSSLEIANQVNNFLTNKKFFDYSDYFEWLGEGGNFRNIILDDGSEWTLTLGRFPNRYIHIHPARYSFNSIRIRSSTLKVATLFSVLFKINKTQFSLQNINCIRQNYYYLSPVKKITEHGLLITVINFILDEYSELLAT